MLPPFKNLGEVDHKRILDEIVLGDGTKHQRLEDIDAPYTNEMMTKYGMYNSRIMALRCKECYSWHRDTTPRVHFPLITNNNCLFISEETAFSMPVGSAYWVDTRKHHTALNGNRGDYIRYHIVGMTNETF
tara:strand:- start:759 stop:1151 length:393 start_codon:yes stop_codon:yes gene_type:complete